MKSTLDLEDIFESSFKEIRFSTEEYKYESFVFKSAPVFLILKDIPKDQIEERRLKISMNIDVFNQIIKTKKYTLGNFTVNGFAVFKGISYMKFIYWEEYDTLRRIYD